MSTQAVSVSSTSPKGLTLSLLVLTAGISLWAVLSSVSHFPATSGLFTSTTAQCQSSADVMASLDRSRNGISLTCNSDMLLESVAR